jgi:hypothetical protein
MGCVSRCRCSLRLQSRGRWSSEPNGRQRAEQDRYLHRDSQNFDGKFSKVELAAHNPLRTLFLRSLMSVGCNCRCRCRHSHPRREMWGKRASTFPHQAGGYRSLSKLGRAYHNQERPSGSGSSDTRLAASIYCG